MSVLFGDAQITTSGFTVLRVSMDNLPGEVAVFSGNAHLDAASGAVSVDLHGGESLALNGAAPANYQLAESIAPDSWDAWNSDRDQAMTTEAASQTGASANLGQSQNPAWNDLDADGNWYDVPNQGYIWSPNEAANADFDPYGNGDWMWTPGYGYLWVSGYPWGYLPFQCGAWNFYDGFGWGWAPGIGGCRPWWDSGYYGGPNFGRVPHGYQPIPRPILPRHPMNPRPVAIIPVRRTPVIVSSNLPARNRNNPVTIGGSTVVPLRPMPSRPVIAHTPPNSGGNQQQPGYRATPPGGGTAAPGGGPTPSGGQNTPNRPGFNLNRPAANQPGEPNRPVQPQPGQINRPAPPQPTPDNRPAQPQPQPGRAAPSEPPLQAPAYRSEPAPAPASQPAPAPAPQVRPAPTPENRPAPAPEYRPAPAPESRPAPPPAYQIQPAPSHNSPPPAPSSSGGGGASHSGGGGGGGGSHSSGGSSGGGGGGGGASHGGGGGGGNSGSGKH